MSHVALNFAFILKRSPSSPVRLNRKCFHFLLTFMAQLESVVPTYFPTGTHLPPSPSRTPYSVCHVTGSKLTHFKTGVINILCIFGNKGCFVYFVRFNCWCYLEKDIRHVLLAINVSYNFLQKHFRFYFLD